MSLDWLGSIALCMMVLRTAIWLSVCLDRLTVTFRSALLAIAAVLITKNIHHFLYRIFNSKFCDCSGNDRATFGVGAQKEKTQWCQTKRWQEVDVQSHPFVIALIVKL